MTYNIDFTEDDHTAIAAMDRAREEDYALLDAYAVAKAERAILDRHRERALDAKIAAALAAAKAER